MSAVFSSYTIANRKKKKKNAVQYERNLSDLDQFVTHIQHDTGAIDHEVLVRYIPWPILTTEYSLPSQWITVSLLLIYFRYDPNNNSNCDEE